MTPKLSALTLDLVYGCPVLSNFIGAPAGTFSGTTQTVLAIEHLSKPEPIEAGKWKLRMIANLYTFTGNNRLGKTVPVNKDIYVRAVYVTPQPLPEGATQSS